uniref:hypothetical protein n=1 Tax=Paraburkholderia dilworthii TaxID=948106 RepID=UPI001FCAAF83|nr:hypothetical protein [Paraburkholderia dilworthii]
MLERVPDDEVPCAWVTAEEVYGGDRHLRLWLESREQPFVLAVANNELLWWKRPDYVRADRIVEALARTVLAASFGRRWVQGRASVRLGAHAVMAPADYPEQRRFEHYLLARRSLDEKRETSVLRGLRAEPLSHTADTGQCRGPPVGATQRPGDSTTVVPSVMAGHPCDQSRARRV